jgi:hypothetical protein
MKFNIIDSIMGSGKSSWAFDYMYKHKEKRFIYVTPYLDEIERLLYTYDENGNIIKDDDGYIIGTKWYSERFFKEPRQLGEGKLDNLHELLSKRKNIATTHALLKMCTSDTLAKIKEGEYTLILDEALDVVEIMDDIKLKDYEMLINSHNIKVNEDKSISWIDLAYDGVFWDFRRRCENGTVVEIKKTNRVQLLIWNFNFESFNVFKEIFVMTYLFNSSLLNHYFDMFQVKYEKWCIEDNQLVRFDNKKPYNKEQLRKLIHIYNGKMNGIGDKTTALSVSWFKNNKDQREKLRNNIYNYFKNILEVKNSDCLWTTFKSSQKALSNPRYRQSFIPCNVKATNDHKHKFALVYCVNRYLSPDYEDYFAKYGLTVNQNMFALSEMIQWIWRSAIRDDKPISIYIPSRRMRTLLIDWLNNENL